MIVIDHFVGFVQVVSVLSEVPDGSLVKETSQGHEMCCP